MIDKSAEEIQDINLTSGEISHSIVLALKRQNLVLGAMTHSMVKSKKWLQACKLAPDIGHLSGKFEGFDWRILSLTGHFDWALPL